MKRKNWLSENPFGVEITDLQKQILIDFDLKLDFIFPDNRPMKWDFNDTEFELHSLSWDLEN